LPGITQSMLSGKKFYYGVFSIYVKDNKFLVMLQLFLGEYLKKTTEYIIRNTI